MTFLRSPHRVILGARFFTREVPLRSRFGNLLTRRVFPFLTGRKLTDTQTGLRVSWRLLRSLRTSLPEGWCGTRICRGL
jgi:hypothetical protein